MSYRMCPYLAFLGAAALSLPAASCSSPAGNVPSITDLTLTTGFVSDYRPLDTSSDFYVDSPQVCCSARVTGASENTQVQGDWIYIKGNMAKEAAPLIRRDRAACDKDCNIGFTLPAPAGGFISGDYRIEFSVDGRPGPSTGFSIRRDSSQPLPQIVTFTASPSKIISGHPVLLNWKVSSASRVDIQPTPGTVDKEGSRTVTPADDIVYTLYAVNRGGVSSSQLSVNVSPQITEKPDLHVTELWTSGNVLAYRVKNTGNLASCPTVSRLYKNGTEVSQDYMAPLAPGGERVEAFQQYHFSPRFNYISGQGGQGGGIDAVNMRVCVNSDGSCVESDRSNNCLEYNFGL